MIPPPFKSGWPVCLLTAALLFCFPAATVSQSSTPYESLLKVVSVKYLPDQGKIEYKLANDGQSAVTAYVVEISAVIRRKYDTWSSRPTSQTRDLLMLELSRQCLNAGPSEIDDDDDQPPRPTIPPGIIQPGKERTDSITTSSVIPDYELGGATPELSARVTGMIWADGRIEGVHDGAVRDMQRVRDIWLEADREEREVLKILKAHPEDGDYQHRINEAIASLKSLVEGYPSEVPIPADEEPFKTMYIGEPGQVSATIRSLELYASLPNPIARITSDIAVGECVLERRIELQEPAMAGRSQR